MKTLELDSEDSGELLKSFKHNENYPFKRSLLGTAWRRGQGGRVAAL